MLRKNDQGCCSPGHKKSKDASGRGGLALFAENGIGFTARHLLTEIGNKVKVRELAPVQSLRPELQVSYNG